MNNNNKINIAKYKINVPKYERNIEKKIVLK